MPARKVPKVVDLDLRRKQSGDLDDDTTEVAPLPAHREQTAPTRLRTSGSKLIGSACVDRLPRTHYRGRDLPLLKQRFVLEKRLGVGGMGTVYRAVDLRKVEARDRNIFVAVKVLNDDFREHPDAFVALQRESAKSQVLAHQNIVSIFDFDKDGDTPFMTMEYLEGDELADLLRSNPDGLPREQAWAVIRGMCEGLKRAHAANITHADFKPGNVFVTSQGQAKVLDFGIARAVKGVTSDGRSEHTLFDPATLGALTPAYASLEMLEGDPPDTRDDIYALAIVTCQVLTGKHPYDRTPADQAFDDNLKPERVPGLSRRQWKGLQKALALTRQRRLRTVEEFAELLLEQPRWRPAVLWSSVAAAVATVTVVVLLQPVPPPPASVVEIVPVTDAELALGRAAPLLAAPDLIHTREGELRGIWADLGQVMPADDPRWLVLRARVLDHYSLALEGLADSQLDQATELLRRATSWLPPDTVWADGETRVRARALAEVQRLLRAPLLDDRWQQQVEALIARMRTGFNGRPWADRAWEEQVRARLARAYLEQTRPGDAGSCRGLC